MVSHLVGGLEVPQQAEKAAESRAKAFKTAQTSLVYRKGKELP
jgi:hypothetical protein